MIGVSCRVFQITNATRRTGLSISEAHSTSRYGIYLAMFSRLAALTSHARGLRVGMRNLLVMSAFCRQPDCRRRGDKMGEQKRRRIQLTKEQKRVSAEQSTIFAFADNDAKKKARDTKTARLKLLRLAAT